MCMAMGAVEDAPVAEEIADVVNRVFSYLFIFLIIKWQRQRMVRKLILIK